MATPDELNLLNNVQFKFAITNLPNVTYFMQDMVLPSMQIDSPIFAGPRRDMPMAGTKVSFDPLMITFLVDEDLNNYYEMYNWAMDIQRSESRARQKHDGILHILSGQMNIIRQIRFVGLVPTFIAELPFTSSDPDIEGMQCTASFAFEYFDFPAIDKRIGTDNPLTFESDLELLTPS